MHFNDPLSVRVEVLLCIRHLLLHIHTCNAEDRYKVAEHWVAGLQFLTLNAPSFDLKYHFSFSGGFEF